MGMSMDGLRSACAALAASDDAAWREEFARACTEHLVAGGPTVVRQATFGDAAEVVEVDPRGILWVRSAADGRRYWTRPENLIAPARAVEAGPMALRSVFSSVD